MARKSVASRLFLLAMVLLLLSIGLCGTGAWYGGTPAQQYRTQLGMLCLLAFVGVLLLAALVASLGWGRRDGDN